MDPLTRHEKIPLACESTRRINMMCWRLREFMLAQRAENANKRDPLRNSRRPGLKIRAGSS